LHTTYVLENGQCLPIRISEINRNYILELLAKFNMTKGAEIGVGEGRYSEVMFKKIPNLELLCVDIWEIGEDKANLRLGQSKVERNYRHALQRLSQFSEAKIIKGKSMDIVRDIPYESLDFVYIDANHQFDFVMQDIFEWSKRVKKGGLVAGHDYIRTKGFGVIEAVNAYTQAHGINEFFLTSEPYSSWFFCK